MFPTTVLAGLRNAYGPRDALLEVWNGVPYASPMWAGCANSVLVHHVHRDMWKLVLEERLAKLGRFIEAHVAPPLYRKAPFITPSASSRQEVIEYYGVKAENVAIAPPGVDSTFQPGGEKAELPLIVGAGRLMPPKRFDELIRVCHQVRRTHPGLELVIIGDGYQYPHLRDLVSSLDAHSWVRLAGYVSEAEKLSLFQRSWAVASASIAEGWGMTLTEAAACGTPAVATRITGHLDSVAHDESGLLASSSREMVEQLTAIIADTELRGRLAEGARKHAAELTWETCAYRTLASLADDAHRRRQRARGRRPQ
ncbi:MAG: glycosyltransferase family 4 protein [Actinobacteria bacterium]|nr:glycosyltransferase family 4 protein [Actinomycetota bacterium]